MRAVKFHLLIFAIVLMPSASPFAQDKAYYAFYPSKYGQSFTLLKHNILGFSIDMPVSWTFGITGKPPFTVALLYPQGLNTGVISEDYEVIEVGRLHLRGASLSKARKDTMAGMILMHDNVAHVSEPKEILVGGQKALRWQYSWQSKSGYKLIEDITLIEFGDEVRSVTMRATEKRYQERLKYYEPIVMSYLPQQANF